MKRFYFFVFILLTINALSQELNFENLSLKNLPSTETYLVLQDSKGIIWIATDAGICRYDGTTTTTYTVKDGISENVVLKIYEDQKKRIWFNTLSGYFFYYEKGHFIKIDANPQLKRMCAPFVIGSFTVGENDTLYITCNAMHGLIKVPPQNNYRAIIRQYGKLSSVFRFIKPNKANPPEIISGAGLSGFNRNDSTYTFYLFDKTITLSIKGIQGFYHSALNAGIKRGRDGTIYVPSRNQLAVVKNNGEKINYYYFPNDIAKIMEDKDGDLWIGLLKYGGYLYKKGDLNSKPIRFLTTLSISSITIDKEGTVWVSTLEKGVFQCMNKHVLYLPGKVMDFRITNHQLNAIFFPNKEIFISNSDSISSVDNVLPIPENISLLSFLKTPSHTYYGTTGHLYYKDKSAFVPVISHKNQPLVGRQLIELENDTILVVNGSSVFKIYKGKIFLTLYPFHSNVAARLTNKKIIIGCKGDEGVFELKNNKLIPYLDQFPQLKARINRIIEDKTGNLWIATNEKGIYCYDTQGKLHEFNEKNGLVSNKVNTCIYDTEGNIWCGTFMGLSKIITSSGIQHVTIENFDKNHGIVDLEIVNLASFNNKIWCAGKTALFYFEPDKMKKNNYPPGLYIKSVDINNDLFAFKDSLFLNYDQNNFHVQCELISYKKTDTKTFLYQLQGYDKSWNISKTGDIQYTNINYGNYTLVVYALNNDNIKSKIPLRITFVIKKPFWYTWWFILFEIIVISIFIYTVTHYWRGKIEEKERDKAAINQKIAEFKMTALRSQMNPHFVFNAISSIQHYILKQDTFKSYNYLAKFSLLIRTILDNSKEEYIALSQEINTLKLYIELEQIRFKQPFKFILDVDEQLEMDTYIPTMLIQPYVENSIWHGLMPKKTNCVLHVTLKRKETHIFVTIKDNGVGRNYVVKKSNLHESKGMSITEQRIKELETTNERKFNVTIIDLTDEKGNPSGTEVQIIIPFDL